MTFHLIEIGPDGSIAEAHPAGELVSKMVEAMRGVYLRTGFVRPWVGYLALREGEWIGTCGFKSPPKNGQVEIAYFTFPEHEGKGVATAMARELLRIAAQADVSVRVTAQTLREANASTAILTKLGFCRTGTAQDDEAGEVWVWELPASSSHGG